jgi:hypothetical protein
MNELSKSWLTEFLEEDLKYVEDGKKDEMLHFIDKTKLNVRLNLEDCYSCIQVVLKSTKEIS